MAGHIHVYTADGKKEATAAFGLALRAADHGKRVFVEQFGESSAVTAIDGLEKARSALRSGRYDVVVLDEIDVALWHELLTQADCLELLDERPDHVDLVLTGQWAPKVVLDSADLVTEMHEIAH